jgi:hypothetical protein
MLHSRPCTLQLLNCDLIRVKAKVTLRLTVSQSVSLRSEPHLGLMIRYLLLFDVTDLFFCGTLSDEKTGTFFLYAAGPCQPVFLGSEFLGTRDYILLSQI